VAGQDQTPEGRPLLHVSFPDAAFRRLLKLHRGDFEIVAAPTHEEVP
jgi:hypothetical protein